MSLKNDSYIAPIWSSVPFGEAWKRSSPIRGWLTREEARHLYSFACGTAPGTDIAEVGSFRGRSTILLASSGRSVYAYDPLEVKHDELNRMTITAEDAIAFAAQIGPYPNVHWERSDRASRLLPDSSIGLLYIDADHQYPQPLLDFEFFRPRLAKTSYVAFHDYGVYEGVTRSVDELTASKILLAGERVKSMYIARVSDATCVAEQPTRSRAPRTEVTGFHFAALCHRYGRRGKSFANSFAQQQDVDFPMHLTIFYSEARDAEDIVEGVAQGSNPITLTLQHVPAEHVIQRALHFHSLRPNPACSHLVYLDCDLWFAPTFWAEYRRALLAESAGYWSCPVKNIPCDLSEEALKSWKTLTDSQLAAISREERHARFKGKVGHFQCVPAGMTEYPANPIMGVNRTDRIFARRAMRDSSDRRDERRIGPVAYHFGHPQAWQGTTELL